MHCWLTFLNLGQWKLGHMQNTHLGLRPLLPDPLTRVKQDISGGRWWSFSAKALRACKVSPPCGSQDLWNCVLVRSVPLPEAPGAEEQPGC